VYGLAVLLTACTVERAGGESGVGACSDGTDNDGDNAVDCADPDCQAESVCGRAAPLREPDGGDDSKPNPPPTAISKPEPDASSAADPSAEPSAMDGAVAAQAPDEMLPDPDDPPDAAVPAGDASKPCGSCAADESCIEGYCVPNEAVFVELWDVVHIKTVFPRVLETPSGLMCIDVGCPVPAAVPSIDFPFCPCVADPLVRVLVTRPGETPATVAETPFSLLAQDEDELEWDVNAQIALRPEYQITLQAIDTDGALETVVFECSMAADAELLGSGTLSCTHDYPTSSDHSFTASITATIQPANPGTSTPSP
jgi:hypothetical protein